MRRTLFSIAYICAPWLLMAQVQTPRFLSPINLATLTNIFLTVDDFEEQQVTGLKEAHIESAKLEKALRANESKPESEDTNGNWGVPSEGFRLSLRFDKAQYFPGEPMTARVLLRNISDRELLYSWDGTDWSFPFTVLDDRYNRRPDLKPTEPNGLGRIRCPTYSKTQRQFLIRLDPHYSLTGPGGYSITVRTHVPRLDGFGLSEIASGTAHIRVLLPRSVPQTNSPAGSK